MLGFYVPRAPWVTVPSNVAITKNLNGEYRLAETFYLQNYNYFGVPYYSVYDIETQYEDDVLFFSGELSIPQTDVPARSIVVTHSSIPQVSSTAIQDACQSSSSSSIWVRTSGKYSTSL